MCEHCERLKAELRGFAEALEKVRQGYKYSYKRETALEATLAKLLEQLSLVLRLHIIDPTHVESVLALISSCYNVAFRSYQQTGESVAQYNKAIIEYDIATGLTKLGEEDWKVPTEEEINQNQFHSKLS